MSGQRVRATEECRWGSGRGWPAWGEEVGVSRYTKALGWIKKWGRRRLLGWAGVQVH